MARNRIAVLVTLAALSTALIACALPGVGSPNCPAPDSTASSGPGSFDGGDGYATVQKGRLTTGGGECSSSIGDVTTAENWTLEGKQDQTITISVKAIGESDPEINLIDPNGDLIDFDDDSGGGSDALLTVTLPADGVYTLRVDMFTEGGYTISVKQGTAATP